MIDTSHPRSSWDLCSAETCCLCSLLPCTPVRILSPCSSSLCLLQSLWQANKRDWCVLCSWFQGRSMPYNGEGTQGAGTFKGALQRLYSQPGSYGNPSSSRGEAQKSCLIVWRDCPVVFGMPWFLGPQPSAVWVAFTWLSTSRKFLVKEFVRAFHAIARRLC